MGFYSDQHPVMIVVGVFLPIALLVILYLLYNNYLYSRRDRITPDRKNIFEQDQNGNVVTSPIGMQYKQIWAYWGEPDKVWKIHGKKYRFWFLNYKYSPQYNNTKAYVLGFTEDDEICVSYIIDPPLYYTETVTDNGVSYNPLPHP